MDWSINQSSISSRIRPESKIFVILHKGINTFLIKVLNYFTQYAEIFNLFSIDIYAKNFSSLIRPLYPSLQSWWKYNVLVEIPDSESFHFCGSYFTISKACSSWIELQNDFSRSSNHVSQKILLSTLSKTSDPYSTNSNGIEFLKNKIPHLK